MPVDEEKLERAFNLVDEAENLARQGNFAKSVYKFQCALDLFDKCGLGIEERQQVIEMVSTRQSEIQNLYDYIREHPEEREQILKELAQATGMQTETGEAFTEQPIQNAQTAYQSGLNQNTQSITSGISPTQLSDEREKKELEGLKALETANNLVQNGKLLESINYYYDAVEKLIQAGWNENMLKSIQETIEMVSVKIQQMMASGTAPQQSRQSQIQGQPTFATLANTPDMVPRNAGAGQMQAGQGQQDYTPTFATLANAPDMVPRNAGAGQMQAGQGQQDYTPTFATLANAPDMVPRNARAGQMQAAQGQQDYTPTFATLANAPDIVPQNAQKARMQATQSQQDYTPTFATLANAPDVVPPESQRPKTAIAQQSQDYTPTFATIANTPDIIPTDIQQPQSSTQLPQVNQPTFATVNQQDIITAKPVKLTVSQEPSYLIVEKKERLQKLADDLISDAELQKKNLEEMRSEAFKLINDSLELEKSGQYDRALNLIEDALDMFHSMPRWQYNCSYLFIRIELINNRILNPEAGLEQLLESVSKKQVFESDLEQKEWNTIKQHILNYSKAEEIFASQIKEEDRLSQELLINLRKGSEDLRMDSFEDAVNTYKEARILLEELGWKAQTKRLSALMQALSEIRGFEGASSTEVLSELESGEEKVAISQITRLSEHELKTRAQQIGEEQQSKLLKLEKIKEDYEQKQQKAFSLIEKAEKSVNEGNIDKAIKMYEEATKLLNQAGWGPQIDKIYERLDQLREMEGFYFEDNKRDYRLEMLKNKGIISLKEELSRLGENKSDEQRAQIEELERTILNKIDIASDFLNKKDFDSALSVYNEIRDLIERSNLTENIMFINNVIDSINEKKKNYERFLESIKKQEEFSKKFTKEFEQYIEQQSKLLEREYNKRKRQLKLFEQNRMKLQQLQERAFKLLDEAEQYLRNKEFDNAKFTYKEAEQTFRQIGWNIDIGPQLLKVEEERRRYSLQLKALERQQMEQKLAQERMMAVKQQQYNEQLSRLKSITQMIKSVAQADTKITNTGASAATASKHEELLAWAKKPKESVLSRDLLQTLRNNLAKSLELKKQRELERKKREEELRKKQEEKEKKQIDDITAMIRAAAKKKKEESK